MTQPKARFPEQPEAEMPQEGRELFARIRSFSLNGIGGPFGLLLRTPELGSIVLDLGERLRFDTGIDERLLELAIMTHAAAWHDLYEWRIHHARALRNGVSCEVLEALGRGTEPPLTSDDERAVYAFARAVSRGRSLDEATFAEAVAVLGEDRVATLAVLLGQYAMLSTILCVARPALPEASAPDPEFPVPDAEEM